MLRTIHIVLILAFMSGYLFTQGSMNQGQAETAKLVKRNSLQFARMIDCATPRSWTQYLGYGCYCGLGGSGTPVDETDRCCKTHDDCYGNIMRENICGIWGPIWVLYRRQKDSCTGCADSSNNECGRRVCECDGAAARCFSRATYNSSNEGKFAFLTKCKH